MTERRRSYTLDEMITIINKEQHFNEVRGVEIIDQVVTYDKINTA